MAKSKARKMREKIQREGRRNPAENRGSWGDILPISRKTPTRIENTRKAEQKHKKRNPITTYGDGDSASFLEKVSICAS